MKIETWYSALLSELEAMERVPHVYGESDCLMRVGRAAAVQLAEDRRAEVEAVMSRYRGRYGSLDEAKAMLKADGLTPLKLVCSLFTDIPVVEADAGDIGAIRSGKDWAFGIFDHGHIHVSTEAGTGILPRSASTKAFRVI